MSDDARSAASTDVCGCGGPLVACEKCGDSRCLACDPYDASDTCSAATPSLADRLRDVDEQNALVVRRRAADRIEELEAEVAEQRSFLLSEVHRAEDERDAERHRAVVAETRLIRGR